MLANMASRHPLTEWGLSPIEERWFIIHWVAVLSDEMLQFKLYNVYKDDSQTGLDVVDDWNEIDPRQYKIFEKHCLILRDIYSFCSKMLYKNITNPLIAVGGLYDMYELQDNPTYPKLKYTKGYVGMQVNNLLSYKNVVDILEHNKEVFQYVVKENCPVMW